MGQHLQYLLGFLYRFAPAAAPTREFRTVKIIPLAKADLPLVRIEVLIKAWLANRAVRLRGDWDHPGVLDADVALTAQRTVAADGRYNVEPRSATLKRWWRDMVRLESQRLGPVDSS